TPDEKVARWASRPIRIGPGSFVQPLVIGPNAVPVVRKAAEANAAPELAVLSAVAHGRGDVKTAVDVALTALRASGAAADFDLYYDCIVAALSPAARKGL